MLLCVQEASLPKRRRDRIRPRSHDQTKNAPRTAGGENPASRDARLSLARRHPRTNPVCHPRWNQSDASSLVRSDDVATRPGQLGWQSRQGRHPAATAAPGQVPLASGLHRRQHSSPESCASGHGNTRSNLSSSDVARAQFSPFRSSSNSNLGTSCEDPSILTQ